MESDKAFSFLLRKPFYLFTKITNGIYPRRLIKITGWGGYDHMLTILKYWESEGIITRIKEGRTKKIFLTAQGKKISKALLNFKDKLGIIK